MSTDDGIPKDDQAPEEEEDFAQLLEGSMAPRVYKEGETVEGRIVSLSRDVAFIDVGGKGEATLDVEELVDDDGDLDVEVGDIVQAVVVSTRGGLTLSHKLARGAATLERLNAAFRSELPVEGRVEKSIKGGYEIRIGGRRAFCPISQIDRHFTEDPAVHEGQLYNFLVIELKNEGKDIVVSRRRLIEQEEQEQAEELRRSLVPGSTVTGRVASLREYGAFVDLGAGIQGLLHVSEMGWSRVARPGEIVQAGDEVTVKILRIDKEKGKIALGLKQLQADPWDGAGDTYEPGQVLMGRVARLADFGAFIELEPGIEALAHLSTFTAGGKRDAWRETVVPGSSVAIEVLTVDLEQKRIGVAVVEEGSVRAKGAYASGSAQADDRPATATKPADADEGEAFGTLADKLRDALRPKQK